MGHAILTKIICLVDKTLNFSWFKLGCGLMTSKNRTFFKERLLVAWYPETLFYILGGGIAFAEPSAFWCIPNKWFFFFATNCPGKGNDSVFHVSTEALFKLASLKSMILDMTIRPLTACWPLNGWVCMGSSYCWQTSALAKHWRPQEGTQVLLRCYSGVWGQIGSATTHCHGQRRCNGVNQTYWPLRNAIIIFVEIDKYQGFVLTMIYNLWLYLPMIWFSLKCGHG